MNKNYLLTYLNLTDKSLKTTEGYQRSWWDVRTRIVKFSKTKFKQLYCIKKD